MKLIIFSIISLIVTGFVALIIYIFEKSTQSYENSYNQGIEFYSKEQYRDAQREFLKAIKINPEKAEAYYNLGLAYLATNTLNLAERNFMKAISLASDDADSYFNLGIVEQKRKNFKQAIDYYNKGLELKNDDSDYYYNLGVSYFSLKDSEKAKEYVSKSLELNPNNSEYRDLLIKILSKITANSNREDDVNLLIKLYKEILETETENQDILFNLAVCYAKTGSWEDSVFFCERIIEINPKSAEAYNQYGLALYCKGEISKSIEMYNKAMELNPRLTNIYTNLTYAYEKASDYENAIFTLKTFIHKFPQDEMIDMAKDYLEKLENENV